MHCILLSVINFLQFVGYILKSPLSFILITDVHDFKISQVTGIFLELMCLGCLKEFCIKQSSNPVLHSKNPPAFLIDFFLWFGKK